MPIIPEYAHQMQLQVPGGAPSAQPPREPDIAGHDLQQAGREVMSGVEALQHAEAQKNNLFVAQTASRLAIDNNSTTPKRTLYVESPTRRTIIALSIGIDRIRFSVISCGQSITLHRDTARSI